MVGASYGYAVGAAMGLFGIAFILGQAYSDSY